MAAVITEAELANYLGFEIGLAEADEMVAANVKNSIAAAEGWLVGALGQTFPREDSRVKQLALIVAADFYDNREFTAAASNSVRRLVDDLRMQVQLEMARGKQ